MFPVNADAATLLATHVAHKPSLLQQLFKPSQNSSSTPQNVDDAQDALSPALLALDLFLQINVTGPVPPQHLIADIQSHFVKAWESQSESGNSNTHSISPLAQMRRECVTNLQVDGVFPYPHIPSIELFHLARHVLVNTLSSYSHDTLHLPSHQSHRYSISWTRLRIHAWHYKLLLQPNLGRSTFTHSSNWIELPTLAAKLSDSIDAVRTRIVSEHVWAEDGSWTSQDKVLFLLEAANNCILLGRSDKAKELVGEAASINHFLYALSGALGKRTKFQQDSISQLVVLATSEIQDAAVNAANDVKEDAKPHAMPLNDDTLLDNIHFTQEQNAAKENSATQLPAKLATLSPDAQPQLDPLDQITLLTEATIKDTFSPVDALTAQEILPFAVRVLADKSTNWQTYTQALLVRSRIELHRSRTLERGILQMQAVADQVLTDTTVAPEQHSESTNQESQSSKLDVPSIHVSAAPGRHTGSEAAPAKTGPTSFFPAPKASESAPAQVRLRYIHALSTPPRWHLEAELAYAWAAAGSLASALQIFKRLRLWAEVALCLATADAADDANGRGSGGERKAKAIIRWCLFNKTGDDASVSTSDPDDEAVIENIESLKPADFCGPERDPGPTNAPRLWCILGELEKDPAHYERAWEVSGHRYARAQRSLAEHYLLQNDLNKAHEAYTKATTVNRLDPGMWSRLGDISLRLGRFDEAAEAFNRSIGCASGEAGGEDAKTWSNLGTAFYSLYRQVMAKKEEASSGTDPSEAKDESEARATDDDHAVDQKKPEENGQESQLAKKDPAMLLNQALNAYKKGAAASADNWRIWENVVTISCYMRPPPALEIINATHQILRIRQSETAVNVPVLSAILQDQVLTKEKVIKNDDAADDAAAAGIYEPPHGTVARLMTHLVEKDIVPLITRRAELWTLVSRLRGWRRDYAGAVDAAEKAWRVSVGSSGGGGGSLLLTPGASDGDSAAAAAAVVDWTEDEAAWTEVVAKTEELVVALETWGPRLHHHISDVQGGGGGGGGGVARWRGKARSAVRSVMGRARTNWHGTADWARLERLMEGLKENK